MSFEPLDYVCHILDEVQYLLDASAGVDQSAFNADATLQGAFTSRRSRASGRPRPRH